MRLIARTACKGLEDGDGTDQVSAKLPIGMIGARSGCSDGKSTVFGKAETANGPAVPRTLTSTPQEPSEMQGSTSEGSSTAVMFLSNTSRKISPGEFVG